jgi:glucuronide carrier protein
VKLSQYLGYGAGDASNNLTFSMVSAFLLIYYTNVAGISAAVAGRVVDKTETRWGKFRPYVLFGSAPLLVLLVALFSIPGGLSPGGKIVWAYVSYALFSLAYSFVNIPYGSLSAAMTQVPDDRAKLSTSRVIAASLTILLIAVAVAPQISGGGDLQRSLTITTVAFAIIGFALYLWCFATSRETAQREVERVSLRETLGMMRHNRPLVLLCAATSTSC